MTEKELKNWIFAWVKDVNGTPLDSEINDLIYMVDACLAPKMKRVDLSGYRISSRDEEKHEDLVDRIIDDIKSKYGDLYTMEGK